MKILVNGEEQEITTMSVDAYLRSLDIDPRPLAVELNRVILPKGAYPKTILRPGDQLEIVWFVGGG